MSALIFTQKTCERNAILTRYYKLIIAIFAIFSCLNLRTKLIVSRLIVAKEKFFKKFKFVFVKF